MAPIAPIAPVCSCFRWGGAEVFMDNHDTQRGEAQLTYKNGGLYSLANVTWREEER